MIVLLECNAWIYYPVLKAGHGTDYNFHEADPESLDSGSLAPEKHILSVKHLARSRRHSRIAVL
jgi:hypothetical protein